MPKMRENSSSNMDLNSATAKRSLPFFLLLFSIQRLLGPTDSPGSDAEGRPLPPGAGSAPAYRYASGDGGLTAVARRTARGWRVVFCRALQAGPGRQGFTPGEQYRFGVAVFDATSTNHHIVRDTQVFVPVPSPTGVPGEDDEVAGVL